MSDAQRLIYLDHAAATPLDVAVRKAMEPYVMTEFANPSSMYAQGRAVRGALDAARAQVADILGAKPTEIVWTSGATEANNLAVQGVLRAAAYQSAITGAPSPHWVTTSIEHDAVIAQVQPLARQGLEATVVPVPVNGVIDPDAIIGAIQDNTVLVSVMLANNEIGTIQPLREIAARVSAIRDRRRHEANGQPLYLHTDAAQAGNYLDLHVQRLGIDLMTVNGGKIYGPKGVGLLYARTGVTLEPLMYGGGQERGRRSGTENVAGYVGLATALVQAQGMRKAEVIRVAALRDTLWASLKADIADIQLNGDLNRRLPNNLNVVMPGVEGSTVVLYLDKVGIQVATGSACASNSLDPSHVLSAIGRSRDEARGSLRFTLGRDTTLDQIQAVSQQLPTIVARAQQLGRP